MILAFQLLEYYSQIQNVDKLSHHALARWPDIAVIKFKKKLSKQALLSLHGCPKCNEFKTFS